jgi:glycosyltransferase involved in cell wall biosynthesis
VGDLGHNKGTWDILAAAAEVKSAVPGARFYFVGRGEFRDLQQRALKAGVEEAVIFLGSVTDEEKLEALQRADVFLLPSYGEGQPLSILEAMAAGLPVVSTTVGSIAEVIEDGANGFLIQPGDVSALARAMIELGEDADLRLRMGKRNRQDARERFSAPRLWRELDGFWRQVTGRDVS